MSRIYVKVDGEGLVGIEVPEKLLKRILKKGNLEIAIKTWEGAFVFEGSAMMKLEKRRESQ